MMVGRVYDYSDVAQLRVAVAVREDRGMVCVDLPSGMLLRMDVASAHWLGDQITAAADRICIRREPGGT